MKSHVRKYIRQITGNIPNYMNLHENYIKLLRETHDNCDNHPKLRHMLFTGNYGNYANYSTNIRENIT